MKAKVMSIIFSLWLLMWVDVVGQTVREYDMDEYATCGRTLNVDDNGVRLNGRGNTAPSNPPLECIVYMMSVYARDDGSNKLQIEVESLNIKDCTVKVDLYNGRSSVGNTLQALSCQYGSTGIIYSTGREVTVRFSRPDRLMHNEYQYSLLIKPYKDQNVPGTKMGVDALPVGAIIGIVIGCLILIALIVLFLWCCCTGRLGNFNVPGRSITKAAPSKSSGVNSSSMTSKQEIIDFKDPVIWETVTTGKYNPQSQSQGGSLYQKGTFGRRFDNNYRNVQRPGDSMNRTSRHDYEQYGFEQQKREEEEARRIAEQKKKQEEEKRRKEEEERRRREEAVNRNNTSKETLIDDVFDSDSARGSEVTDDTATLHKRRPSGSPKQKRKGDMPETKDMDKGNLERYMSMDLQSHPDSDTISSPLHINGGVRASVDDEAESPNASLRRKKKGSPLSKRRGKEPDPTALPPEAFEPIFTTAITGINYPGNQQQNQFGYPGGFYPYGLIPAGAFAPGPPGTQTYAYAYQTVPQAGAAPQGGAYFVQDTPTTAGNLRKAYAVEMSPNKRTPESRRRKNDPFKGSPYSERKGQGRIRDVIPNPDLSLIARGAAPPDPGQGQRSVALKSGTDPKSGIHTTQVVWTDTVPDPTDPKPGENPQITRKTITRVTTKSGFAELPPETNILMLDDSEPSFLAPSAGRSQPAIMPSASSSSHENLAFYTGGGVHNTVAPPPERSSTPNSTHEAPVYNYAIRDRIPFDDSTV
ncbi:unnamed protein product [Lymnaea stagnalis]|uniref:CUB domain-containing protein n=1 Tax=Lymnaea stagnalis TaxID=6523 RepID=A0AAV2I233_LYMST